MENEWMSQDSFFLLFTWFWLVYPSACDSGLGLSMAMVVLMEVFKILNSENVLGTENYRISIA